jgi:predicted ATPase
MQQELGEYGQRRTAQGAHALDARVGINTGEVVVRSVETGGKIEYTPIGHTANLASRLQALAPVGSVAVSEYTRTLCEGYFEMRALGPMAVRGISEPINVYEVTGPGPLRTHFQLSARRGLTKFVGREGELAQMQRALELAMSGHGQVLAVRAEAGTGKSRLFYEFKATLPAECKVLEAYSVSHGKASAWLPVLELLRKYFGIADGDHAATRREKVGTVVVALDPALQDTTSYLFGLLGIVGGPDPIAQMDPQIKQQRTLEAIKRIVVRESLKQPLIVIFEDLHWIDEQTQALLDLLSDNIGNARVLLLVNYRPEYRHEWSNKSHYAQIGLKPLGRENAEELLTALLGDAVELQPLKRLIVERTGGNPFFIEEMVRALFDEGALVRNGAVKVTRSLSQLRMPPTVQGILAARIDRLSAEQKELLQTLAAIGREAPLSLIRKVTAAPEVHVERMLAELRAAEFVYEQPALGDTEYVFKHALTQEVAYNSLLIERRKQIHERVGSSIEALFADDLDDHVGSLAHHYSHSDNADKTIEYLGRVGQQALRRSAHDQAIRNLSEAIKRLMILPDSSERKMRELSLQMTLGPALIALTGWGTPEVERTSARARELSNELGDPPELFGALFVSWVVPFIRAHMRAAYNAALVLIAKAEATHDRQMLLMAHAAMGMTLFHMGEAGRAADHFRSGLALDDPARPLAPTGIDLGVNYLSYQAWALWHLGYPERALKSALEAVARAQTLSHPHTAAFANGYMYPLRLVRREFAEALEVAEQQFALCSEYGLADFLAGAIGVRGSVLASQGHEEGIPLIEQWIASTRRTGLKIPRPFFLCLLAEACMAFNQLEKASGALDEALSIAELDGDRYCETETHRLRGELLLKHDELNAAQAQACFERAIEVARNQVARSWELRATTSLARLLASQGHRDEARAMLAEIYNWFTEGFDTADLKEAKALLDELSR